MLTADSGSTAHITQVDALMFSYTVMM
uniref:Uncharacterized protein n=1 Tax=Anguilla anguilla TaxID=7936 RepID=A0A0E9P7E0_ANGAN